MRSSPSHPRESGFVLIGVVMFVLALTIIGLSLFGLSSYEAQFFSRAEDQTQAFFVAQGGIQRAMFALSETDSLASVGQNLPPGVVSTVAVQYKDTGPDSTGDIEWDPSERVLLRVNASVNGTTQTIRAWFQPEEGQNYYKRLITCVDTITVNSTAPSDPNSRCGTPILTGQIWQSLADSSWWVNWGGCAVWTGTPPLFHPPAISAPSVPGFLAVPHTPAQSPDYDTSEPDEPKLTFDGTPNQLAFFTGPFTSNPDFTFHETGKRPEIKVKGYCVWLLPKGAKFEYKVKVEGQGARPCLAIVAEPSGLNTFFPDAGIWFNGGVEAENDVSIILVSNGRVLIEHINNYLEKSDVSNLSIFANKLFLTGPRAPVTNDRRLALSYSSSTMEPVINYLAQRRALPNITSTKSFRLVSGTWQELTP